MGWGKQLRGHTSSHAWKTVPGQGDTQKTQKDPKQQPQQAFYWEKKLYCTFLMWYSLFVVPVSVFTEVNSFIQVWTSRAAEFNFLRIPLLKKANSLKYFWKMEWKLFWGSIQTSIKSVLKCHRTCTVSLFRYWFAAYLDQKSKLRMVTKNGVVIPALWRRLSHPTVPFNSQN